MLRTTKTEITPKLVKCKASRAIGLLCTRIIGMLNCLAQVSVLDNVNWKGLHNVNDKAEIC